MSAQFNIEDFLKWVEAARPDSPLRPGLTETPKRFFAAWEEWTAGYGQDPAEVLKVFEDGAESYDELIIVPNIPVWSHCEHHIAPIWGLAHVGYVPSGKIVGLSKIARLVDVFAKRLQVQERMTVQIADAMWECLKPISVGVVLHCRHGCMESRGIKARGTGTITSALRGAMKTNLAARQEFFSLVNMGRAGVPI